MLFGLIAAAAAIGAGSAKGYALTLISSALVLTNGTSALLMGKPPSAIWLWALFGFGVVFTFLPFLRAKFSNSRLAWVAGALAGPALLPALYPFYLDVYGPVWPGLVPALLAVSGLAAALLGHFAAPVEGLASSDRATWFGAVAGALAVITVPIQWDHQWLTIGWAIEALVFLLVWRKLDHPGLKYASLVLWLVVTLRLTVNPAVWDYQLGDGRLFNGLLYTFLIPLATLLYAVHLFKLLERTRLRPGEMGIYRPTWGWGLHGCGAAAIVVFFFYLNHAITRSYDTESGSARDLTLSLAWALYALGLMALAIKRRLIGLRRVSLGFIILTISKVFLYDLGELTDLYRAFSLLGLAFSLLLVSVIYQKFVVVAENHDEPP